MRTVSPSAGTGLSPPLLAVKSSMLSPTFRACCPRNTSKSARIVKSLDPCLTSSCSLAAATLSADARGLQWQNNAFDSSRQFRLSSHAVRHGTVLPNIPRQTPASCERAFSALHVAPKDKTEKWSNEPIDRRIMSHGKSFRRTASFKEPSGIIITN